MSSLLLKRSRSCSSILFRKPWTRTTTLDSSQLQNFTDSNQSDMGLPSGLSSVLLKIMRNQSGSNRTLAKTSFLALQKKRVSHMNLKDIILASGYCIWRENTSVFGSNMLLSERSPFGSGKAPLCSRGGFRFYGTQATVEPSTSDGLTVDGIVANRWTILDESESDWKSHAAAVAQSIQGIKKCLQWKKLMIRLNLLSAELNKPNLWDDPVRAGKISHEHGSLLCKMKKVKAFEQNCLSILI